MKTASKGWKVGWLMGRPKSGIYIPLKAPPLWPYYFLLFCHRPYFCFFVFPICLYSCITGDVILCDQRLLFQQGFVVDATQVSTITWYEAFSVCGVQPNIEVLKATAQIQVFVHYFQPLNRCCCHCLVQPLFPFPSIIRANPKIMVEKWVLLFRRLRENDLF